MVAHSAVVCFRWADFDRLWDDQRTGAGHLMGSRAAAGGHHSVGGSRLAAAGTPSVSVHAQVVRLFVWPGGGNMMSTTVHTRTGCGH